jgi:hypothetical protein
LFRMTPKRWSRWNGAVKRTDVECCRMLYNKEENRAEDPGNGLRRHKRGVFLTSNRGPKERG